MESKIQNSILENSTPLLNNLIKLEKILVAELPRNSVVIMCNRQDVI